MIKRIDAAEAVDIIQTRQPLGLYICVDEASEKPIYIGIDNITGDAWTEEFALLSECKEWLTEMN